MSLLKKIILLLLLVGLLAVFLFNDNIKEIAAGVSILLFGMLFLEDGFKSFTGGTLEKILKSTTKTVPRSLSFGIVSTSLLQSSSLVSIITISFLGAGLMNLSSGIGVIFGANLGTTTGAWLISIFGLKVKISSFALPLLVFGIALVLQKSRSLKGIGYIIAGIGFLFLGIHFMKEGFDSFKDSIDLKEYAMTGFWGLMVFTGLGIAATVIMQSSHATLAIILAALSTSQITYVNALALAIGANIGTTVTAIIGAISSNSAGKRLAGAHMIFNFTTGLIALIFISQLRWAVDNISLLLKIGAEDFTLKLSLFHTLFNLIGVLLMIPLIQPMILVLNKIIKDDTEKDISQPKYINDSVLTNVTSAIPALVNESKHLFDNAFEIIAHSLNMHRADILSDDNLKEIVPRSVKNMRINIDDLYFKKIKIIYGRIIESATSVQSLNISEDELKRIYKIKVAVRLIVEVVKFLKIIQPNMAKFIVSENELIKIEYNTLRRKIAKVIREIYKAQTSENPESHFNNLMEIKTKLEKHDVMMSGSLDKLIREQSITREMATSLINDSGIVRDICTNLISISELIYLQTDQFHINQSEQEEMFQG
ncbi:MAG: Na/Pi symporter [Melioribacteraceae bacterium]|nr:Na/Pi symporter [Melioribacteraceae bacterium]MCF8356870.1 Na/Pi symporter [Melioribacteraceae bacterium]MCF8420145.1 Na/Pi symporter [Melioribacteraceae bacterium]